MACFDAIEVSSSRVRPPSRNRVLLQLARAQCRDLRDQNATLRQENGRLHDELTVVHQQLNEALAAVERAATVVAAVTLPAPAPSKPPHPAAADPPLSNSGAAPSRRASSAVYSRVKPLSQALAPSKPVKSAAEESRRRPMATRRDPKTLNAVLLIQSCARGWVACRRLAHERANDAAVLRLQAVVRGNAARGIAERRRFA